MRNQVFKKLFSVLLALIMVAGLLPASVLAEGEGNADSTPAPTEAVQPTESAEPTEPTKTETPEVTEVPEPTPENPAATVEPTQGEPTAEPTDEGIMPANVMPVQANVELQYRIVHLDCGRKYFSKDWIIALMHEAKAAGYNQVQLAFGNKGLRFLLKDMSVNNYDTQAVTAAIQAGNEAYYDAGEKNELTEAEMNDIFAAANEIGIEIVPLFNTPFHMEAVITAMGQLNIQDAYYGKNKACLNLSNDYATAFVKALMQKYITYFQGKGCKYFNFGADEYTGGWNSTFYNYANEIVSMISAAGMNARIFNDSFRSDSNNGYVNNAQVCYWSSNSGYASTATVYNYAKEIINTNQDFYYVVNKDTQQSTWSPNSYYAFSGSFDETTWVNYAKNFSNTTYKNFAGYNNGAESITPVGSMFCIWCDNPSHKDETQIAKEIRMILRVIGARMQNSDTYSTSDVLVEGGFKADGTINTSGSVSTPPTIKDELGCEGKIDVAIGTSTRIYLPEGIVATWTVTEGKDVVELVAVESDAQKRGEQVVEFADAAPIIGNAVMVKTLKAGTATVIATLEDGTAITATVEVTDNAKETITVVVGKSFEKTIDGKYDGTYNTDKPEIATVTAEYSQTAGVTHYEKATLSAGTFFISNNANDTNPTVTVTFEDAGEGKYYIKNSNGEYIYPNATYRFPTWSYSLGKGKEPVTITSSMDGVIVAHRQASSSTGYPSTTTYLTLNNSGFGASGNRTNLYIYTQRVEQGIDQTKLTFTGHKEGTTTVTVAGVEYTIEVVPMSLENAEKLYIDFWVTNHRIYPTNLNVVTTTSNNKQNARTYYEFSAADFHEAGEEGRVLTDVIPQTGNYESTTGTEALYWKTRYLPNAHRQTEAGWTNKSGYGTDTVTGVNGGIDIERIRFYGGKWEYKAVGKTDWEKLSGTTADETGNQIAVYYLLKTTITDEVTTYITDWPDNQTDKFYGVAVDYCVKYESDGVRNPDKFGRAQNSNTQWLNCDGTNNGSAHNNGYSVLASNVTTDWKGLRTNTSGNDWYRVINNIRAVETAEYEIYMVTVTPSESFSLQNQQCPENITYNEQYEKVIWAESQDTIAASGLAQHSEAKIGGEPNIDKLVIQQCSGMLVTYYVRAKASEDSLTVNYYVDGSQTPFHTYNIAVPKNTTFSKEFALTEQGGLINNTVINIKGKTETVQWDLKLMPQIGAQYRYTQYKLVRVAKVTEEVPKTVNLYYTFNATKTFVVDFGLPLRIEPKDLNEDLGAVDVNITKTEVGKVSSFAEVIPGENGVITYKLTEMISDKDTFGVKYTGTLVMSDNTLQSGTVEYTVTIIPATNVYYEDSFAKFNHGAGAAASAMWTPVYDPGTDANTNANTTQALEALGQTDHNPYGYDPAYQNSTMFSMGSAQKVTVTNDMAKDGVVWPTAQFTFKGTGFDIISLTDNTSGAIFVDVYKGNSNSGEKEKGHVVNNYYGYTYSEENGWKINNNPNAIYQVPVIKVSGLTYGEHTVVIKVCYDKIFDVADGKKYSFWLDAVRVYDPAGNTLDNDYVKDSEVKPIYVEVRKAIIGQSNFTADTSVLANGAVFIDGKSTGATLEEYKNFGPNHEVYLAKGQAIAFRIVADKQPTTMQIGVKLANGSSGELTLSGSNAKFAAYGDAGESVKLTLNTATDMYYALNGITWTVENGSQKSNVIVLTNTGENSIVSITNVKCTYASITENTTNAVTLAISYDDALMAVDAVNNAITPVEPEPEPEPEPEKTFEPERFEASWSRNVMQGRKATLTVKTSEDVEAITVDGQTIRSYRTRTERMGFGRRAKRITYREFTYSMVAQESADFSVTAINAEGTESEAITARLTVKTRPNSMRDMWDWFKGWF